MKQLSSTRKKYTIFGLDVVSDFILDELFPSDETGEIEIIHGTVPGEIDDMLEKNELFQASRRELLLNIRGVAKYLITDGKTIVVEPYAGASYSAIKLYLLGTAFGSLLLLRGLLPIHGTAVMIDGNCVLVTGISGAGKSTLSLAFREKGHCLLTDDIAVLYIKEDSVWVQPSYPQQKIWRDSADSIGVSVDSLVQVSLTRGDKYFLPSRESFYRESAKLTAIYELKAEECHEVCIRQLEGSRKMSVLLQHTYRAELLPYFGLEMAHFIQCADAANRTPVYQLIRPNKLFTTEQQILLIKAELIRISHDIVND